MFGIRQKIIIGIGLELTVLLLKTIGKKLMDAGIRLTKIVML